jgi:hypothetical protein
MRTENGAEGLLFCTKIRANRIVNPRVLWEYLRFPQADSGNFWVQVTEMRSKH